MVLTVTGSENNSYNSLYLLCQNPFSHTGPNILRSTFLSKTLKLPSLLLVYVQLSATYIGTVTAVQCLTQSQFSVV
jgi:hypothetical protein